MRDNTAALCAEPGYSIITDLSGVKWGLLKAPSVRAMHDLSRKHARTCNEMVGLPTNDTEWLGLNKQSFASFDETGIAEYPRDLLRAATATMPHVQTRPGSLRPAITGSTWNIPAVISGVPLAAIARQRNKVAPLDVKIAISFSAYVKAADLAPRVAKLARALHDYTLAGGVVNLTIYCATGNARTHNNTRGLIVETRVNAADQASLALALSPAWLRCVVAPLSTAHSSKPCDILSVARTDLPGILQAVGGLDEIFTALDSVIKKLQVS